jgi:amino acid permease
MNDIAYHNGIFRRRISYAEGVALITSGTIGAGVLGIPYVVAQVGIGIGIAQIIFIGLLMTGVNLLLGEAAFRAGVPLQLSGLAEHYLGRWGKWVMMALSATLLFGALAVYIIGEGQTLSALFGGTPFFWSTAFFLVGSLFIFLGLRTVKVAELFLSLGLFVIVLLLTLWSAPHIRLPHLQYASLAQFFLPYGVLIFAYHGASAIPEAFSILPRDHMAFRKVILAAGGIIMAVYALFALAVVGVTGPDTTEIATIGLGRAIGEAAFLLGNLFAAVTMGTSFLLSGVVIRDSLAWDFHLRSASASLLVCAVPYAVFALGLREFVSTIDVLGNYFITLQLALIALIYIRSRRTRLSTAPLAPPPAER